MDDDTDINFIEELLSNYEWKMHCKKDDSLSNEILVELIDILSTDSNIINNNSLKSKLDGKLFLSYFV